MVSQEGGIGRGNRVCYKFWCGSICVAVQGQSRVNRDPREKDFA